MRFPVQITYRNMEPSEFVSGRIRGEVAKLETFYGLMTSCRVVVEIPHKKYSRGRRYQIRIDLTVPGGELVVNHEPSLHGVLKDAEVVRSSKDFEIQGTHRDIYVSIRDAFDAARRRLQEYSHRQRRLPKLRTEWPAGRQHSLHG